MSVKLLTEHHLKFLSLKVVCTGSSESTLVKIPHCWKSHVVAHLMYEPVHENLVLNAHASSTDPDESVYLSSLAGALIPCTSKEWTEMKVLARSRAQVLVDTYANTFEE